MSRSRHVGVEGVVTELGLCHHCAWFQRVWEQQAEEAESEEKNPEN
jgi:hypothetical protein